MGTDQGHKDSCAKSRMFQFLTATVWKGPPQVLPHGSVQCHAVQVVGHLWWKCGCFGCTLRCRWFSRNFQ